MALTLVNWDEPAPRECRHGALTIGNFDGVHRGHAALLAELRTQARAVGGPAVALTFDPHPLHLLRPDLHIPVLTTLAERARLLHETGAEHVVILRTTREFLRLGAAEFHERVIRAGLAVRAMVEGTNFAFGRDREGTIDTLTHLCQQADIRLAVVPPFVWKGEAVSSSRIRAALQRGAVRDAADLLDRPYRLQGRVAVGRRRGRTLGFPTANLEDVQTLIPADGVYAVRVTRGGAAWRGAANVGPNPTFGEQARKVEVHLLDFEGDLYGEELAVDFVDRLRDTRPFAGVQELIAQLHADVRQVRELVAPH